MKIMPSCKFTLQTVLNCRKQRFRWYRDYKEGIYPSTKVKSDLGTKEGTREHVLLT